MTTKPLATSCHPNKKNGQDEWQNFLLNVRPLWGTSYLISQSAGVHMDADRLPELVLRSAWTWQKKTRAERPQSDELQPRGSHAARQRSLITWSDEQSLDSWTLPSVQAVHAQVLIEAPPARIARNPRTSKAQVPAVSDKSWQVSSKRIFTSYYHHIIYRIRMYSYYFVLHLLCISNLAFGPQCIPRYPNANHDTMTLQQNALCKTPTWIHLDRLKQLPGAREIATIDLPLAVTLSCLNLLISGWNNFDRTNLQPIPPVMQGHFQRCRKAVASMSGYRFDDLLYSVVMCVSLHLGFS